MSGALCRITVLMVLCALLLSVSWLLLPSPSEHAERRATSAPGAGAGEWASYERHERSSRKTRPATSPSTSTPDADPKSSRSPLTGDAALEAKVVDLVNAERVRAGCGVVRHAPQLSAASQGHSEDMAKHDHLSHTGSDGSSYSERAEEAGYRDAMSENIAMGYRTARAVVDAWMKSEGHRQNILACQADTIGVGVARSSDQTPYWTQMFGRA